MSTWNVTLPISGTVWVQVEADSEEEAITAALDGELDYKDVEWEVHNRLCYGNVCGAACREAYAEKEQ